jgi:hypothetical protein
LPEEALVTDHGHTYQERAVTIQPAADGLASGALRDQVWLARDERFIHVRFPRFDHAVDRHPLTWADAHHVTHAHVVERHIDVCAFPDDVRHVRLEIQELLDRLRAAGFHDQRQPLGKDVIREYHDRYREKRHRRVVRRLECQADNPASKPSKGAAFHQHVLVENVAPQCADGHMHDVLAHAEDEDQGEHTGEPRSGSAKRAAQLERVYAGTPRREPGRADHRPEPAIAA